MKFFKNLIFAVCAISLMSNDPLISAKQQYTIPIDQSNNSLHQAENLVAVPELGNEQNDIILDQNIDDEENLNIELENVQNNLNKLRFDNWNQGLQQIFGVSQLQALIDVEHSNNQQVDIENLYTDNSMYARKWRIDNTIDKIEFICANHEENSAILNEINSYVLLVMECVNNSPNLFFGNSLLNNIMLYESMLSLLYDMCNNIIFLASNPSI